MQKRHRIFIAINLPNDIKKMLGGFEKKWPDLPAKWVGPQNLHITLVFLGDITDEQLGQVCMAVKEISQKYNSLNVSLHHVAYGPEGKIPPRYIWVGGEGTKELSLLKKGLEDALSEEVKFNLDNKPFAPHITLARIKEWEWRAIEPEERPEVNETIALTFTVESIEVMESELKRGGPQYIVVESHALQ